MKLITVDEQKERFIVELTKNEAEIIASFGSSFMNVWQSYKSTLEVKTDVIQGKLDFDNKEAKKEEEKERQKKERREEGNRKREENKIKDPYYGSDQKMKEFLLALDSLFEKKWTHIDHPYIIDSNGILERHNKTIGVMCNKLRVLKERGHCDLRFRGNVLKWFYLKFRKDESEK